MLYHFSVSFCGCGDAVAAAPTFDLRIMAHINTIFSVKTFAQTSKNAKAVLRGDITTALASTPAIRKEIARVFQMVNRRIQNVEKAGLISPAVQALNKGHIQGYTKFSMRQSWNDLKLEYSKAISFLKQPTSTAGGAREYNKHLQKAYDLTPDEFNLMAQKLNNTIASVSDTDFVERYLMRYKDFTGELERTISDVSQQIESDAVRLQNTMERNVDKMTNDILEQQQKLSETIQSKMDKELQRIQKDLDKFGV